MFSPEACQSSLRLRSLFHNLSRSQQNPLHMRYVDRRQVFGKTRFQRSLADHAQVQSKARASQSSTSQAPPPRSAPHSLESRARPPQSSISQAPPPRPASHPPESPDTVLNKLVERLERQGHSLIYTGPSHTGSIYAAWIGGVASLAMAAAIIKLGLHQRNEELPWFVPAAYRWTVISFVLAGVLSVTRSYKLVTSIKMRPGRERPMLHLDVRRNLPLPLLPPRKIIVPACKVIMARKLVEPIGPTPLELIGARTFDEARRLGLPRRTVMAILEFFTSMRQFVYLDGVLRLYIPGYWLSFKLSYSGTYRSEAGGPPEPFLYRLVTFK